MDSLPGPEKRKKQRNNVLCHESNKRFIGLSFKFNIWIKVLPIPIKIQHNPIAHRHKYTTLDIRKRRGNSTQIEWVMATRANNLSFQWKWLKYQSVPYTKLYDLVLEVLALTQSSTAILSRLFFSWIAWLDCKLSISAD